MYDKYTIGKEKEELMALCNAQFEEDFWPNYNAHPTRLLPVITNKNPDQIQLFKWGLISTLSNNKSMSPKLFNLPLATAISKPMHQRMLSTNRCIILADGFYLWKQLTKKQKAPYYFHPVDHSCMFIAGIWEEAEGLDGTISKAFNMITLPAIEPIDAFQEDRPAILNSGSSKKWLQKDLNDQNINDIVQENLTIPLTYHPVSPRINNLNIQDKSLIEPTQPSDQHGNYTLF